MTFWIVLPKNKKLERQRRTALRKIHILRKPVMAKKTGLGLVLVLLLGFTVLLGCAGEGDGNSGGNMRNLDLGAETERLILQDYADEFKSEHITVNDIYISKYYGTYNGGIVLNIDGPWGYPSVLYGEDIAGIWFYGSYGSIPFMWKNRRFYGLQEAYDLGLLTKTDLRSIADLFDKSNAK